jgi:hypothetical protein
MNDLIQCVCNGINECAYVDVDEMYALVRMDGSHVVWDVKTGRLMANGKNSWMGDTLFDLDLSLYPSISVSTTHGVFHSSQSWME